MAYQLNHTGSQINDILDTVDDITTVNGIVKCDGEGDVSKAIPGSDYAPAYTYGTDEMEEGTTELATGTLYFQYEE